MAMVDGRVVFVGENIDFKVWCYLDNKNDSQPVAVPE
jgi:hypothetical protein